jgi:hypothetical protein
LLLQLQLLCVASNLEISHCAHLSKNSDKVTVRTKDNKNDIVDFVSNFSNTGLAEDTNGISSSKTNFELHVSHIYIYIYVCVSLEAGEKWNFYMHRDIKVFDIYAIAIEAASTAFECGSLHY